MKNNTGNPFRRLAFGFCAATSIIVVAGSAHADQVSRLAKELAELRGEVEALSQELSSRQNELTNDLKSYARQKAELEAEVQREKIRLQKVRVSVLEATEEIEEKEKADKAMRPGFENALPSVKAYVEAAMPFRRSERLAELVKLDDQYKANMLTPERAIARLWSFVEDEARLTRESGMYRQTITVGGEETLADVIRIGMVMMYYRTADGGYGHVAREGSGWTYQEVTGKKAVERVEKLFESFRKQIRSGYFELPPAIVASEDK